MSFGRVVDRVGGGILFLQKPSVTIFGYFGNIILVLGNFWGGFGVWKIFEPTLAKDDVLLGKVSLL